MPRRRFNGLWRHSDFMRLWAGQTISGFGSLIGATAIGFTAILVLHATPFQLGILAAPGFLTELIAGAWVDRLRRRPILIGADIGRGLLLATIPLRATAACTLSKELFGGMHGALVVLCMVRDLGFAAGILGTIWALGGPSSLVGAVAADPTTRRFGIGPTMIVGLILYSIALLFIPLARGATVVAALLLIGQQTLGGGSATLYQINRVSFQQAITPEGLLGRVNASVEFLKLKAALVGSLLGGLMGNTLGVRTTLVAGALGSLLSSARYAARTRRRDQGLP